MEATRRVSLAPIGGVVLSALRIRALPGVAVLAILAVALGLRLYGLDWDQGYSYTPHPDERAILAKVGEISPPVLGDLHLLLDADESPWNPRWFPYGSFPLYLLKGVQLLYSLGPGDELADLRVAGRVISALADAATVLMVFLLGRRVYGRRVGFLASGFAAIAVIHIQLSHFFAVDTFMALFTVVALYFMYGVARQGRLRDSALAGVFIGLGLATKVSLAPLFGAFVVAHLLYAFSAIGDHEGTLPSMRERWGTAVRGLLVGVVASVAVLFVVQPYAFLDWGRFWDDVVEQSEMVRRIRDYPYTRQYIDTTPYWYHVRQLATWGLGWPLGVVAWAGFLYASLRGMRWRYGLAYLVVGWGLPMAILLLSLDFKAIVAASAVAVLVLLATLPFRSRDSRAGVLLLSWVVPYFLITGALEVKFLRYLIPITPILLLFGSWMLCALWDGAVKHRPALRPWLVGGLVALIGATGFYALSYMAVYQKPHTAVRASQWINENVPKGSVVLKEHWEEGLPNLHGYQVPELGLYEEDSPFKVQSLAEDLARGDYLVFFSNRLYGTIPRLLHRYPLTGEYYRLLFSGELGYELVDFEATYPRLLGVSFVDDTFRRPRLPEPDGLKGYRPSTLSLGLGFADESFSVYDHPKVLVMRNVARYDAGAIRRAIEDAAPSDTEPKRVGAGEKLGLMLSPEAAEAQREGGTWTDIISTRGWANRLPVAAWLIVVEGIALLALPITLVVFRPLADRGYLFSKILGLLLVGLAVWLLASLRWMAFSQASIALAVLLLAVASGFVIARKRGELVAFLRERWRVLLVGEVVFLAAFLAFLVIRMANPDLWHPWRGGEKPMDLAYLNAVLRSSYMPPFDPWFGGGHLNYYYWGQFIVATLIKATRIEPAVAYNLAVPTFFALTAVGAFAIVYNLAEGTRRRLQVAGRGPPATGPPRSGPDEASALDRRSQGWRVHWPPLLAGLGGAVFVTVLGNLDGAIQVGQGIRRAAFQGLPFGEFDFWRSSRMMPSDLQGITEFPFFTFLFADLHAHMMALPFTLLVLGLALTLLVDARGRLALLTSRIKDGGVPQEETPVGGWLGRRRLFFGTTFGKGVAGAGDLSAGEVVRLAFLGLALGSLRLLNAWDFPTYLIIAVAVLFVAELFAHGRLGLGVLVRWATKSAFVFVVGYLAFLPFHLRYETFFDSLETTTDTTVLWRFLAVNGLFIFIVGSFLIGESRGWLLAAWRAVRRAGFVAVALLVALALLIVYLLAGVLPAVVGSTIPFVAVMLALVVALGVRWLFGTRADSPQLVFVALMVAVSLGLVVGLDVYRIEGDIDRMNSIFKFYLQVWVLLALASAYLLWRLAHGGRAFMARLSWVKKAWLGGLAVLVVSAAVYPVMGTQDRLRDRFYEHVTPMTLDGTAYVDGTVYRDERGEIDLAADFEGIRWLQRNVQGSPIVLEGHTPTYRWGGRVSKYTGLPTVVGWKWHQEQQRWDYRPAVSERIADVGRIYETTDPSEALTLLRRYGVGYVYVGQLERLYYPGPGLDKFDGALGGAVDKVFHTDLVAIYRVRDGER